MTFGRPPMVSDNSRVPLPAVVDDEYLQDQGEGHQPADEPSQLGMFVSSCQLFELLQEVLRLLLENDTPMTSETHSRNHGLLMSILDLNNRLDQFSARIPLYLQFSEDTSPGPSVVDGHVQLQRRVLQCR